MKKRYALLLFTIAAFTVNGQTINFPDVHLKAKLLSASPNATIAQDANFNYVAIDTNNDQEIQVSEAQAIKYLSVDNASITDLTGITNFSNLEGLFFSDNQVTSIDLSGMPNLRRIACNFNELTNLNVSGLTNLISLTCRNNHLQALNLSGLINLTLIECSFNYNLQSLNLSGLTHLENLSCYYSNLMNSLDLTQLSSLQSVNLYGNNIQSLNVAGLSNLVSLDCGSNQLAAIDLTGLTNLQLLGCGNNHITNLDLTGLTNLQTLACSDNLLTSLDLTPLSPLVLRNLSCANNQLSQLNISGFNNLSRLLCNDNQLQTLDLSGKHLLQEVNCSGNQIQNLEINQILNLTQFNCSHNQLTLLNISNISNAGLIDCSNNQLATLDLNSCYGSGLNCANNQLETLLVKNGFNESLLDFSGNPNLQYICADEAQIPSVQTAITANGYTNCHVNSYCSFTPGGTFYTIQGNNRYDENTNGCDSNDINFPNLKLSFTDGVNTGNLICDTSGIYHYDVQYGTQTITPILENPVYFAVSPASATVTFPNTSNTFDQDFCIAPNGIHNDLEITILPLSAARPGFDAAYKIIYKNKGTHTQSGSINASFDDSILDFIYANPAISNQGTNTLTWSFLNLVPFESREISFVLNINSPMETPAVVGGDILHYTASITGLTDETPNDNAMTLNQSVVNSFDPNDKTCLEGNAITPDRIGNYVHYMIRFENTGTFPAQNIVVKDVIDTTKFDISSLIPETGSHNFITRINGNKVEFIFESINLPFDDAHNDGYVAFKIKTKPTLVLGDTFSNSADIYFDYNFPITTNTAATTISLLNNHDFDFGTTFSLAPVPAKNVLTITKKQEILISSVTIYNTLGQLVQVNANPNETIDVSGLQTGSYLIRIMTDKGTAVSKFIKE